MLNHIIIFKFRSQNAHFLECMAEWRLRVNRCELQAGYAIYDSVKLSMLLDAAPNAIKRQLQLDAENGNFTAKDLSQWITAYCQLNIDLDRPHPRERTRPRNQDDMDVDVGGVKCKDG